MLELTLGIMLTVMAYTCFQSTAGLYKGKTYELGVIDLAFLREVMAAVLFSVIWHCNKIMYIMCIIGIIKCIMYPA